MRYKVVLAGRAICRPDMMRMIDFIPGTEQTVEFDTASGAGQEIWWGYLQLRQDQKGKVLDDDDWRKVRVPEDSDPKNEIHKFREAVDLFFRFLAGEGRDNCNQVKSIELVPG